MDKRKVILITGSRKGIGRFLAEHFSKKGELVEGCSRDQIDWDLPGYKHHVGDVTNENHVKSIFSSIRRRHGKLDVTINNAGIASMNHSLLMPLETAKNIINVNLCGTFLVSRESVKLMRKRKYGRIINFSTIAVPLNIEGEAIYAASKSAIETFTKIFAREVAEYGITCNAVAPAPTKTDLIRGVPEKSMRLLIEKLSIKRFCKFEDISNVIDFLLKSESDYITGQIIYLGGV